jgi:hypothetical protein
MDAQKAIKGCNAKITLNGVDISGESNSYSITVTKDTDEITSFGNCTAQKLSGKKDWNGSVDCLFTNDLPYHLRYHKMVAILVMLNFQEM